jgi:hypothetical protein
MTRQPKRRTSSSTPSGRGLSIRARSPMPPLSCMFTRTLSGTVCTASSGTPAGRSRFLMNSPKCVWRSRSAKTCPHHKASAHRVCWRSTTLPTPYRRSKSPHGGRQLNKHHSAVLVALGSTASSAHASQPACFASPTFHIPHDQYLNQWTAVLAARIGTHP